MIQGTRSIVSGLTGGVAIPPAMTPGSKRCSWNFMCSRTAPLAECEKSDLGLRAEASCNGLPSEPGRGMQEALACRTRLTRSIS